MTCAATDVTWDSNSWNRHGAGWLRVPKMSVMERSARALVVPLSGRDIDGPHTREPGSYPGFPFVRRHGRTEICWSRASDAEAAENGQNKQCSQHHRNQVFSAFRTEDTEGTTLHLVVGGKRSL